MTSQAKILIVGGVVIGGAVMLFRRQAATTLLPKRPTTQQPAQGIPWWQSLLSALRPGSGGGFSFGGPSGGGSAGPPIPGNVPSKPTPPDSFQNKGTDPLAQITEPSWLSFVEESSPFGKVSTDQLAPPTAAAEWDAAGVLQLPLDVSTAAFNFNATPVGQYSDGILQLPADVGFAGLGPPTPLPPWNEPIPGAADGFLSGDQFPNVYPADLPVVPSDPPVTWGIDSTNIGEFQPIQDPAFAQTDVGQFGTFPADDGFGFASPPDPGVPNFNPSGIYTPIDPSVWSNIDFGSAWSSAEFGA